MTSIKKVVYADNYNVPLIERVTGWKYEIDFIQSLSFVSTYKFGGAITKVIREALGIDETYNLQTNLGVSEEIADAINIPEILRTCGLILIERLILSRYLDYIWHRIHSPHVAPAIKKIVKSDNYNSLLIWDASKGPTSLNLIKQLNLFDSYIIEAGVEYLLSLIKSSNLFDSYSLDVEQFIKKSIKSNMQSKADYSLSSSTVVSLIQLSLINNAFQVVRSLNLSDKERQKLIQLFTDGLLLGKYFTLEEIHAGVLTLLKGLGLDDSYKFEIEQKLEKIIELKDYYTIQELITGFLSLIKTLNLDDSYTLAIETQLQNLLMFTEKSKLKGKLRLTDYLIPQSLTQFSQQFQLHQNLEASIKSLMSYDLTETEAITLNSLFTVHRVTTLTLMESLSLHDSTVIAILMILTKQMTLAEAIEEVSTITAVPIKEIITALKKILVSTSLKEIDFSSSKIWQS